MYMKYGRHMELQTIAARLRVADERRRRADGAAVGSSVADRASQLAEDAELLARYGYTWDAADAVAYCRAVLAEAHGHEGVPGERGLAA